MKSNALSFVLLLMVAATVAMAAETPPITTLHDLHLNTVLVENGTARCVIAIPAQPDYQALGAKLADAVEAALGVRPAVRQAVRMTDDEVSRTNVLALGVFANNPVIEKLYHRGLVSCDWTWPKGERSCVIRSVHNPWLTGRNVICIQSVTPAGCADGITRFADILKTARNGALTPLLEVQAEDMPAAPDDAAIAAALKLVANETSSRSLGGVVASYADKVFRTGQRPWADLLLAAMRKLDKLHEAEGDASDLRSCRYVFQQFDRIDEAPAFSADERLELVRLFHRFATRMTYAKREVKPSAIPHGNNWNAIGASYAGLYFSRYYPELPVGRRILDALDVYYEPNMVTWKVNEDCPGYGNITLTGNYNWALARPDWRYFDQDCLRRMVDYDMLITDNAGRCSGFGDANGLGGAYVVPAYLLAAWLYKDGRYLWWWDQHIGQPGRYWVPPEVLARRPPDDLLGVVRAPLDEWIYRSRTPGKTGAIPLDVCFDKVSFRSGLDTQDQYLCVSGFSYGFHSHPDANAIIRYRDRGQVRLYDDGYMIPALSEHNTVTILKDGWAGATPDFSQVTAQADFSDVGLFESRLDNYTGTAWDRAIIWVKGRSFLVIDDLQCKQPGDFSFQCIWRTLGNAHLAGRRWTSEKDDSRFHLMAASDAVLSERQAAGLSLNAKPFPLSQARALVQAAKCTMAAGDSYQFANLFHTTDLSADADAIAAYRVGASTTYVVRARSELAAAGVTATDVLPDTIVEANIFYVTAASLAAAGATNVSIAATALSATAPVDLRIDLVNGAAEVRAQGPTDITFTGAGGKETKRLAPGRHTLRLAALPPETTAKFAAALADLHQAAAAAIAQTSEPAPGTGLRLQKLWEYTDFRAYTNLALLPDVTCSADRQPLAVGEVGYGTGDPKDLVRPSANIMFPAGQAVRLDITLPAEAAIAQVTVKSRQLATFRGGCGIRRLTVWASTDGFRQQKLLLADFTNTKALENTLVPYALRAADAIQGRSLRIEAQPYTAEHKIYLDSITVDGIADKSQIVATGFHLNGLAVADVDGDGRHEVFAAGTDRAIHAINSNGEARWCSDLGTVINGLAVIAGSGKGELQIACAGEDQTLYAVKADGTESFTVTPPPRTYARAGYRGVKPFQGRLTVVYGADIDGDNDTEIVVGSANWRTYVYDHKGRLVWDEVCWAHTPTCGAAFDLDGDGTRELIMGNTYTRAVVYSHEGKVIGNGGGSGHAGPTAIACADLDGNGRGEIIVGDRAGLIWFQEWNGRALPTHTTGTDITDLAVADLDGDGRLETVAASRNFLVYVFDADGKPRAQTNLLTVCRDIVIADVLGDSAPEIICACEDNTVKIVSPAGEVLGWFRGAGRMRHVAACELDGNPQTRELVAACDDGTIYALQATD